MIEQDGAKQRTLELPGLSTDIPPRHSCMTRCTPEVFVLGVGDICEISFSFPFHNHCRVCIFANSRVASISQEVREKIYKFYNTSVRGRAWRAVMISG